jgi:hypothetical protein
VHQIHPLRAIRRVWRARWQAKWRELRPLATIVVATAAFVLGTIGYLDYRGAHYGVLDALYRAPLLFAFGGTVSPPVPVTLQIARLVAPIVTGRSRSPGSCGSRASRRACC